MVPVGSSESHYRQRGAEYLVHLSCKLKSHAGLSLLRNVSLEQQVRSGSVQIAPPKIGALLRGERGSRAPAPVILKHHRGGVLGFGHRSGRELCHRPLRLQRLELKCFRHRQKCAARQASNCWLFIICRRGREKVSREQVANYAQETHDQQHCGPDDQHTSNECAHLGRNPNGHESSGHLSAY
jgi:hypothetical protein